MQLVIFDDNYHKSFYPITLTRVVGDIRCGILKLRQRLEYLFGDQGSSYVMEPRLEKLYCERHPDWEINAPDQGIKLYVNSRLVVNDEAIRAIKELGTNQALLSGDQIVALCTSVKLEFDFTLPKAVESIECSVALYQHLPEVVHDNPRMITWDFENIFYEEDNFFETEPGVHVLNPYRIWIAEDVSLAPNVVLDATDGPIVIDEGAKVMANSVICGPTYIGKKSVIKIGAKIYGGVSIGPVCKVGGEVEGSIFQAYTNKQHDGFLGHSYLGEWVNLGADTNNSDLKNTYRNVNVYNYRITDKMDSGTCFMGCIIGDHSKTGINTSLNTGVVIGIGCNVYGPGLFAGFIPSFSWGEADSLTEYRYPAFCNTASIVKKRRNLELSSAEMELYEMLSGE
ncbi:MAG: putative sugar nucleotidyl transferase [Candidatus Cloacimonetes bacterium]|jgi:UDP-N-acetylglucosamine diphosphorylase/glucosamine-1-phosphate N-acetyltransferase|nr:putative sugar nucleotidyl transferase [Candidatus Cloacimonadota bacterium]MDD4099857.1 putative sugar nucleotidyl transferase [Candidatus Cloacimonadota bacterium]MDD4805304.1 putative sugar nucleotidyl transferase [Candidatus Cloacimonadota bacterium]